MGYTLTPGDIREACVAAWEEAGFIPTLKDVEELPDILTSDLEEVVRAFTQLLAQDENGHWILSPEVRLPDAGE